MNQQNQKLYVGNLNFEANEEQLRELFGAFGTVLEAKIVMDRFTGRSRGFAFVRFDTAEAAGKAKEALNGQPFQGKTLVIDLARTEQQGGAGAGAGGGYRGGERRERPAGGFGESRPRREWGDRGNDRGGDRGGYRGGSDRGNDRGDRGDRSGGFYNR